MENRITPIDFLKLVANEAKAKNIPQSEMLGLIVELLKIDGFFQTNK